MSQTPLFPEFTWLAAIRREDSSKCLENGLRIQYLVDKKFSDDGQVITMQAFDTVTEKPIGDVIEIDDAGDRFPILKLATIKRWILVMFFKENEEMMASEDSEVAPFFAGYLCYYETMFEVVRGRNLQILDKWIAIEARCGGNHTGPEISEDNADLGSMKDRIQTSARSWRLRLKNVLSWKDPRAMEDEGRARVFDAVSSWLLGHIQDQRPDSNTEGYMLERPPPKSAADIQLDKKLRDLDIPIKQTYTEEELKAVHEDLIKRYGCTDNESYGRALRHAKNAEKERLNERVKYVETLLQVQKDIGHSKAELMAGVD